MSSSDFKVSVITPVFNAASFVSRAVDSAARIDAVGEVILIEDGSTDNSLEVCRRLAREEPKVRLLAHGDGQNLGAGASRNLGILNAQFDFVAFLDADDFYLPNRFHHDALLFEDEAIDGVFGALGVHFDSEQARIAFRKAGFEYQEFLSFSGTVEPEQVIDVLFHAHPDVSGDFHTDTITVRKEVFSRSGLFEVHLRLKQDIHLWRKLAAVGRLCPGEIHVPIAVRGVHAGNRMTNVELAKSYDAYWWQSLHGWFISNEFVSNHARLVFLQAYERWQILHASRTRSILALMKLCVLNPSIIRSEMEIFDLGLLRIGGYSRAIRKVVGYKNALVRKLSSSSVA